MERTARRYTYSGSIKVSRSDMRLARAGRKKCTIRMGTASVAGTEIVITDGRVRLPVKITGVDNSRRLGDLTDQDARDEGFMTRQELISDLRQYYPRSKDEDHITVIYFEVLETNPSLF